MIDNEFSSKILAYLDSGQRTVRPELLAEAGARAQGAFKRQLMEERIDNPGTLRMSSGGTCARKQWYTYTGAKGEPLSARTINTFLMGEICEVGLSILARLAGWTLTGKPDDASDTLGISIPKYTVVGHLDDLLYNQDEKEYYVVEYKSMSDRSYAMFEKEGISNTFGYETQISLYCHAMKVKRAIMVAMNKNLGTICDRVITMRQDLVDKAIRIWTEIVEGKEQAREFEPTPETVYNRSKKTYDPTGRMTLPITCQYCSFCQKKCWPNVTVEIVGGKPKFILPLDMPT